MLAWAAYPERHRWPAGVSRPACLAQPSITGLQSRQLNLAPSLVFRTTAPTNCDLAIDAERSRPLTRGRHSSVGPRSPAMQCSNTG
jgi:hypothetical protein